MDAGMDAGMEILWVFGQMMLLPAAAFACSLELLLQTVRQFQAVTGQGIDIRQGSFQRPGSALLYPQPAARPQEPPISHPIPVPASPPNPGEQRPAAENLSRRRSMRDSNFSDDMVKLIRFTIVSIKRDDEHILANGLGEKIVTDNMDDEAFASWVLSEYFQRAGHEPIDDDDKKYLRVYSEVLRRWPQQDRKYEKRQLGSLEGIEEALQTIVRDGLKTRP
jgi:hypothetical protein